MPHKTAKSRNYLAEVDRFSSRKCCLIRKITPSFRMDGRSVGANNQQAMLNVEAY
jgi:hypothetical protein